MAKNKSSKFGVADGFFDEEFEDSIVKTQSQDISVPIYNDTNPEQQYMEEPVAEVVEETATKSSNAVDNVGLSLESISDEKIIELLQAYKDKKANKPKEIGETRGRKGMKLPRINMCFSDLNYQYIKYESCRRGMNNTQFVNMIIQKYRESSEGYID